MQHLCQYEHKVHAPKYRPLDHKTPSINCAARVTVSREEVTWLLEPRPSLSVALAVAKVLLLLCGV